MPPTHKDRMLNYARMRDSYGEHQRSSIPYPKPSEYYDRPLRADPEQFSSQHHNISNHQRSDFYPPADRLQGSSIYASPPTHKESRFCSTGNSHGHQHQNLPQPYWSDYGSGVQPGDRQQGSHRHTHIDQFEDLPGPRWSDYFDSVQQADRQHPPPKYNNPLPANQNNDFSSGRVYNPDEPKGAEQCLDAACSCINSYAKPQPPPATQRKTGNSQCYPTPFSAPALNLPSQPKISDRCFDVARSGSNHYSKASPPPQQKYNPQYYRTPSATPPLHLPPLSRNMSADSRQLLSNIPHPASQAQMQQVAPTPWQNAVLEQGHDSHRGRLTEQIDDGQRAIAIKGARLAKRRDAEQTRFERSRSRGRVGLPEFWHPASPEPTISARSRSPERGERATSWQLASPRRRDLAAVRAEVENEWALEEKERWPRKKRDIFDLNEINLQVMEGALCGQAAGVVERGHYRTDADVIVVD